ncbi:hypothetical protein SMKC056_31210 [Serratia marcescens]|nr:hypothetical protein SMKC056_31210 [Serratia marcescens]
MDNKLSELSKPEQFDAEVEIHGGEPFAVWAPAVNGSHVKAELYFALLAELEAKDKRIAELEAIRADASQVFKEIGNELGCNPDNESIMMAIDALKERLATPVRLPRTFWYEHDDLAHEIPVLEKKKVVAAICGAGFTVEGDE